MRLQDYSQIRGVNHHLVTDPEILKRDMSFMNRLNLNSTRIWLSAPVRRDPPAGVDAAQMRRMFPSWLNDREEYCRQLRVRLMNSLPRVNWNEGLARYVTKIH